jgi:hypothetical protein
MGELGWVLDLLSFGRLVILNAYTFLENEIETLIQKNMKLEKTLRSFKVVNVPVYSFALTISYDYLQNDNPLAVCLMDGE